MEQTIQDTFEFLLQDKQNITDILKLIGVMTLTSKREDDGTSTHDINDISEILRETMEQVVGRLEENIGNNEALSST